MDSIDISDVRRRELASEDGFKLVGQIPDIQTLHTIPSDDVKAVLLTECRSGCNFGGGQLFCDA